MFNDVLRHAAAGALKPANYYYALSVAAGYAKGQAGKQRILVIAQPQRALTFALGFPGRGCINRIDHALFCMELNNGLFLRAGQRLGEGALFQAIDPVIMVNDSVGAIVRGQATHQILPMGLAGQCNLSGEKFVEIVTP